MSAFMVNPEHIDAMVRLSIVAGPSHMRMSWYATDPEAIEADEYDGTDEGYERYVTALRNARREARSDTADAIGQMLAMENAASVLYRYPDHDNDEFVPAWATDGSYTYSRSGRAPTPVEGLKLLACYEYQSCEHPGWKDSEARRFCEALRDRLINALPGYDEAPWEWSHEAVAR